MSRYGSILERKTTNEKNYLPDELIELIFEYKERKDNRKIIMICNENFKKISEEVTKRGERELEVNNTIFDIKLTELRKRNQYYLIEEEMVRKDIIRKKIELKYIEEYNKKVVEYFKSKKYTKEEYIEILNEEKKKREKEIRINRDRIKLRKKILGDNDMIQKYILEDNWGKKRKEIKKEINELQIEINYLKKNK